MEIVVETEYQDIYRVTDGVLLIVNKFRHIDYSSQTDRIISLYDGKFKSYNKNCQKMTKGFKGRLQYLWNNNSERNCYI